MADVCAGGPQTSTWLRVAPQPQQAGHKIIVGGPRRAKTIGAKILANFIVSQYEIDRGRDGDRERDILCCRLGVVHVAQIVYLLFNTPIHQSGPMPRAAPTGPTARPTHRPTNRPTDRPTDPLINLFAPTVLSTCAKEMMLYLPFTSKPNRRRNLSPGADDVGVWPRRW